MLNVARVNKLTHDYKEVKLHTLIKTCLSCFGAFTIEQFSADLLLTIDSTFSYFLLP